MTDPLRGHVYVLTSPNCEYVKIGGTDYAPLKRIREINSCEPYRSLGPWSLHDFRELSSWRSVERSLHYALRSKLVRKIRAQRELFSISAVQASKHLSNIDEALLVAKPKVDRMFQQEDFAGFLKKFLRFTGILNWLSLQGAWTLSLFPKTKGGRYYTLNIGTHEVAFATVSYADENSTHMLCMDRLIRDFKSIDRWVRGHSGRVIDQTYSTALPRSTAVFFKGSFEDSLEFLELPGVRRAIIAYWTDALMQLQERGSVSSYSKHHNWNAVAALKKRLLTETS